LPAAQEAAEQSAEPVRTDALLLFLPAEIPHHDRSEHHHDLRDLPRLKTGLIANLLGGLALIVTQDMSENSASVSLTRRRGLLAEDHSAESAEVIQNAPVVIGLKSGVQALCSLRVGRIVRQPVYQHRQGGLNSRIDRRLVSADILTDLV
jgi:hypothetical protein